MTDRPGDTIGEGELLELQRKSAADLFEALFVIADGEGDPQVIARQTLEAAGLPVPGAAA